MPKSLYTDDTALAIATASAYCDIEEGYDDAAAAISMVSWLKSKPKDVGNQTCVALNLLDEGYKITGNYRLRSFPRAGGRVLRCRSQRRVGRRWCDRHPM